jgi:hypothetical protein
LVGELIQRNSFVKNEKDPQPTFTWKLAHVSDGKQNFPLHQLKSIMQVKVPYTADNSLLYCPVQVWILLSPSLSGKRISMGREKRCYRTITRPGLDNLQT